MSMTFVLLVFFPKLFSFRTGQEHHRTLLSLFQRFFLIIFPLSKQIRHFAVSVTLLFFF